MKSGLAVKPAAFMFQYSYSYARVHQEFALNALRLQQRTAYEIELLAVSHQQPDNNFAHSPK